MYTLEVNNLSKIIKGKYILKDISFYIERNTIVGLVGVNGSGKSTLLKTILGLYKATSGTIRINGYDLYKESPKALKRVGSLIENPGLYEKFSLQENIKVFSLLYNKVDTQYVKTLTNMFKLDLSNSKKIKNYSFGMKQRVGIMLALLNKPSFLILDEPTNGLDYFGITELRKILKELKISILISSHNLGEIQKLCDKVLLLENGKIVEEIKTVNKELESVLIERKEK